MRDIRIAVGICRLQPFNSNVRKPWLVPFLIYLGAAFGLPGAKKQKGGTTTPPRASNPLQRALTKQAEAFLNYAKDYLQSPAYTIIPPKHGRGYAQDTPRGKLSDEIEQAGELISWGIPELRAWGMPLGMANAYRIIARRAAGNDIDVVTPEDKEFQEKMAQQKLQVVK